MLGAVYIKADRFGARLRERVGAPEEPAGQRRLFPSAAGASAERRIGPRRSFFHLSGCLPPQAVRYWSVGKKNPPQVLELSTGSAVCARRKLAGPELPAARGRRSPGCCHRCSNAMTWPRARRAGGQRFSHGIRHLGVVAASGEKMLLDMI